MNLLTRAYISMKTRSLAFKEDLQNDERGVGAIVATVLILLICVLMIAVFYDELSKWFSGMMEKIFGENSGNDYGTGAFER